MSTAVMRKEITGIFLFFLVLFTAVSLGSFSPDDPSVHNVASGETENFFGLAGAHLAGLLIGLFGVGAFWVPVLLLIACVRFYTGKNGHAAWTTGAGGAILLVVTGALMALFSQTYQIVSVTYPAAGMIGLPLHAFLLDYADRFGAFVILFFLFLVGFILTTGISVIRVSKNTLSLFLLAAAWVGRIPQAMAGYFRKRPRLTSKANQSEARANAAKKIPEKQPEPIKSLPVKSSGNKKKGISGEQKTDSSGRVAAKTADAGASKSDIRIKTSIPPLSVQSATAPRQQEFESMRTGNGFKLPKLEFLDEPVRTKEDVDHEHLRMQSRILEEKLADFGVQGSVKEVLPGPVITRYEFAPAPGVKINKIVNLADDLALALKALSVRIIAPIPGKAVIGIELPNDHRETVGFKDIVSSGVYTKSSSMLTIALGKDIVGHPVVADLEKMPHLLIAGATGTGKSVALNTMITSILYKATPEDVKFIMIDPKRIELSIYDGIPHLIAPVVTDMKKATNALFWAVREMERRYKLLSGMKVRNIRQYNTRIEKGDIPKKEDGEEADDPPPEKIPYVVVIIDELADLMMVSSRDVEVGLTRLAQMARAAGIHMIIATQRPSVDVLTGLIKANFPTRLSFQVSSKTDSRTIIDANGAEALLGNGDMLFLPPGTAKLQRIHGAYVSEDEVTRIIAFLKSQKTPEYDHNIVEAQESGKDENSDADHDEKYDDAVALVTKTGQASISMVQRHLRIGYNRAARIIETMEAEGVVGPSDGVKPREILVRGDYDNIS